MRSRVSILLGIALSISSPVFAAPIIDAPSSWFMGSVTIGSIGSQGISIGNTGNQPLTVTGLSTSGSDFSLPSPPATPFVIAPGGVTTITVRFTPSAVGTRTGNFIIASNDPITPIKTVSLTGTGLGPQISTSPAIVDFGNVNLLSTADRTLTIGNDGNQPLTVSGISFTGSDASSFSFPGTPPSFPQNVPPGGILTLTIRFAPSHQGPNGATAVVSSNDPIQPSKLVNLTGNGIGPILDLAPLTLSFGDVHIAQSADLTVQVANSGGGILTVSALGFTGASAGSFSLVSPPSLPRDLPSGSGFTLTVRFTPTTIGAKSVDLVLTSNDASSPERGVPMTGNGTRPEPVIAGVRDVPNDQGGKVKLSWDASTSDTQASPVVDHYWIFRSVPPQAATASGERVAAIAKGRIEKSRFYVSRFGANTYYWELLDEVRALHVIQGYSYLAATTGDSMPTYNPLTLFMVMALNAANTIHWDSAPDSGYSVDNLAPAAPALLTGSYFNGATHLHWARNAESDLSGYRVYRGASAGFVPGPSNLIGSPPDTGFAHAAPAGGYYKLAAVDRHGNESGYALLTPSGTLDVPLDGAWTLALSRPAPNPSRGAMEFGFTLPEAGEVSLSIFDAQGRRVSTVLRGPRPAGRQSVRWDGRDEHGRLIGNGAYFVRLGTGRRTLTTRFAIMR